MSFDREKAGPERRLTSPQGSGVNEGSEADLVTSADEKGGFPPSILLRQGHDGREC